MSVLSLDDIRKAYGPLEVLHGVSLRVESGETVALVGPSGAGKTTLLQIAGTLDRPDSGRVRLVGEDVFAVENGRERIRMSDRRLSEFRNRHIGFVFQNHQLLPEFTAQENVALPAMIAGLSKRASMEKAASLLEQLGLAERLRHKPAALSGGERQRTAIARALVNSPEIVMADEPTGSLDTANRDQILEMIEKMRQTTGASFLIVTHDPDVSARADRTVMMRDGIIIKSGETLY